MSKFIGLVINSPPAKASGTSASAPNPTEIKPTANVEACTQECESDKTST